MPTKTDQPGITFEVDEVEPATEALATAPTHEVVEQVLRSQIESCSSYHEQVVAHSTVHPLIWAVHLAWTEHRPLRLSPDMIWLAIVQGVSQHVRNHAPEFWSRLAADAGQLALEVQRGDLVRGSPENLWAEIVDDFAASIRTHLPKLHDAFVPEFSTTGRLERMAFQTALMEAVSPFFRYDLKYICGIPRITLDGTPDDWDAVARGAGVLADMGMDWWLAELKPVLGEFAAAARGKPNRKFWKGIYVADSTCFGESFNGWIGKLIPYTRHAQNNEFSKMNPMLDPTKGWDVGLDVLPPAISRVPFYWIQDEHTYAMELVSGLIGVAQDSRTLEVRPKFGWAVRVLPTYERAVDTFRKRGAYYPPNAAGIRAAGKRFPNIGHLPPDFREFYTVANGGRIIEDGQIVYDFLCAHELRPFPVREVTAEGEAEGTLVPLCKLNDGRAFALLYGEVPHNGAIVLWPAEPEENSSAPIVADNMPALIDQACNSPATPFVDAEDWKPEAMIRLRPKK